MGNEGQDNSQPPVNEVNKHPWEIFPEANSSDAKKSAPSEAELEKKRLKREKRDARRNSRNLWIKKHKILSLGIFLVLVALIVGAVFLAIYLTKPKETPVNQEEPEEVDLRDFSLSDIPNGEFLQTKLDIEMYPVLFDGMNDDGTISCSTIIDNGNSFIKTKKAAKEYDIIYTFYMYASVAGWGCVDYSQDFIDDFDKQGTTLNDKQRFVYNYMKYIHYSNVGNSEESKKYYDLWLEVYIEDDYYYDSAAGKFVKREQKNEK